MRLNPVVLGAVLLAVGTAAGAALISHDASAGPAPTPTAPTTSTPTITPTPSSIRPARYIFNLTANGQDGPIEVLPGSSVTFAWELTTDVYYFSMSGTVTNDTFPELDAFCNPTPTRPCEGSYKVVLSSLGTVTNTAHAKMTKVCFKCPVTTKDDTVIVHVVAALSTPTATATSTATFTRTPTSTRTPPSVGGVALAAGTRRGGPVTWWWLVVLSAAGTVCAAGIARRVLFRR